MFKRTPPLFARPIFALAVASIASALPQAVDTFEDLGLDGAVITNRVLDGVTVTYANSGLTPLTARTYGSSTDVAFTGAGGDNLPLLPGQVSGTRFISAVEGADNFDTDVPIVFTLSEPVAAFGLTTLDLLEALAGTQQVILRAFDGAGTIVAEHERNGDQDTSGATLLWRVSSSVANIEEVHLLGQVPPGTTGYGIDDIFLRKEALIPFQIEVSQETAPGTGDFDANVLGLIDSSDYYLNPEQYYSWFPTGTSFSGPGITSSAGSSLSVFRSASTGERCVAIIHDRSEDGSGGSALTRIEVQGDTNGATPLVKDDDESFGDTYGATPDNLIHTMTHSWSPCCTDGVLLGAMEGDWSVLVEFTAPPTGLLTWSALSNGSNSLALTLEVGRRVRLRSLESDPPVGTGDCFADGTGAACPCGNETTPGEGCSNSLGSGAVITGVGSPSVTADNLVLSAHGVIPNQNGVIFTGPGASEAPFGDGLRCVGAGSVFRYPIQNSGPSAVMVQGPGLVAYSLANFPVAGQITAGMTWRFQAWYRDPFGPCSSGFNLSNAVEVLFGP
ncbi:MAG: hypothetical protein ACI835_005953, partial [Planctomycetota bacterium]